MEVRTPVELLIQLNNMPPEQKLGEIPAYLYNYNLQKAEPKPRVRELV